MEINTNCLVCGKCLSKKQIGKRRKTCGLECGGVLRRRDVEIGEKFGKLSILREVEPKLIVDTWRTFWRRQFECKCECGNLTISDIGSLGTGHKKSCGCIPSLKNGRGNRLRHGLSRTRIYKLWCSIKQRCSDPNTPGYDRYGGRGVRVCEEWVNSFENFYEWAMKNGFREDLVLDKDKKVEGNLIYGPEVCSFITANENSNYTRRSLKVIFNGEKMNTLLLSNKVGITDRDKLNIMYKRGDFSETINVIHDKTNAERSLSLNKYLNENKIDKYVIWEPIIGDIAQSHKKIVKWAMENNQKRVIIFEDDIFGFKENSFWYFLSKIPNSYGIFLCGVYGGAGQFPNEGNVVRTHISGLHCYIVHQRAYQKFLDLDCENESLDNAISRASIEGKMRVVCCYPFAAAQRESIISTNPLMKGQVNLHRFFFNSQNMYGYAGNGK